MYRRIADALLDGPVTVATRDADWDREVWKPSGEEDEEKMERKGESDPEESEEAERPEHWVRGKDVDMSFDSR